MRTSYIYPIVLIIVVAVLGVVYVSSKEEPVPQTSTNQMASTTVSGTSATTTTTTTTTETAATSFTSSDVAMHNSEASCWTSINGSVYDVTSWVGKHPGGEGAIISLCGKDGSSMFNGKHGGQEDPMEALATYRIGALAQ